MVGYLQHAEETSQHAEAPLDFVARSGKPIQIVEEPSQMRSKQGAQGLVFVCFDQDGADRALDVDL